MGVRFTEAAHSFVVGGRERVVVKEEREEKRVRPSWMDSPRAISWAEVRRVREFWAGWTDWE